MAERSTSQLATAVRAGGDPSRGAPRLLHNGATVRAHSVHDGLLSQELGRTARQTTASCDGVRGLRAIRGRLPVPPTRCGMAGTTTRPSLGMRGFYCAAKGSSRGISHGLSGCGGRGAAWRRRPRWPKARLRGKQQRGPMRRGNVRGARCVLRCDAPGLCSVKADAPQSHADGIGRPNHANRVLGRRDEIVHPLAAEVVQAGVEERPALGRDVVVGERERPVG